MLPDSLRDALALLVGAFAHPEEEEHIRQRWRLSDLLSPLAPDTLAAADVLAAELPDVLRSDDGVDALVGLLPAPEGEVVLAWCAASAWRRDIQLCDLLSAAARLPGVAARVSGVAAERVLSGPLGDALACVPLIGGGAALDRPENAQARARLEILIWEAGASARQLPDLGRWIFGDRAAFRRVVEEPAHGTLRGRVLAARCLEVTVCGFPRDADSALVGATLAVLQPLLLHPEPLVWIHAARALGRLTGSLDQLEGMLLDWVQGEASVLRQRALTALASLPAARLGFLASQLESIIVAPQEDAWVLAAIAAATPYLFYERSTTWDLLATHILAGDGGAISARALARGLATLWRRGSPEPDVEALLLALRERARRAASGQYDDGRRWIDVIATTDIIDGAERDPFDLEQGLDNLVRVAAQYDDEEADARAARLADSLGHTFIEALKLAMGTGRPRQRAAASNAVEGCARSFALRLWDPLLETSPAGEAVAPPNMDATWKLVADAPATILDVVRERREQGAAVDADLALEVLAVRVGGYALDACGLDSGVGGAHRAARQGRAVGLTAHETCHWLRKLEGLADGSRVFPASLETALAALLWRLVDTTRGTTLGHGDDAQWLGPFAAWWALVIDRPSMLLRLASALPMMSRHALAHCVEQADVLRAAVASGVADGGWCGDAAMALGALHAHKTELAAGLTNLANALAGFADAGGTHEVLDPMCLDLVLAADRLHGALADPVKALRPCVEDEFDDTLSRRLTQNAPRVASLVARAIRGRDLSMLDVWLASLGPVVSALVETAVRAAISRTPPPTHRKKKQEPTEIQGYELVRRLGDGGIGSVWLVRKPGADRLFVLKIPKADVLEQATDVERAGILSSFEEEAAALAGLYHPNVANIIDRGVSDDVPFLVLEYLIGADLRQYSKARAMTLFELRQVVLDTCAGLAALHGAGLVHRDIKPANLWLRLPLAGGVRFDPENHRDPAVTPPLSTVVIDFGMVRATKVPADAGGRFVAGTAGYIAPEQVLDPVELDPRADVYALAGTIYNVTTGRAFFDDVKGTRERVLAHMRRDPFEDAERVRGYPAGVVKLLRAATTHKVSDRPTPLEFGRAFADAL